MTACAKEKVWVRSIYSSGSLDSVKVSLRRETWLMTENQLVGCQPLMLVHFNILQLINMCFYYIFEYCRLASLSVSFGRLVFCSDCIFRNQWLTFLRRLFYLSMYLRKIICGIKKKTLRSVCGGDKWWFWLCQVRCVLGSTFCSCYQAITYTVSFRAGIRGMNALIRTKFFFLEFASDFRSSCWGIWLNYSHH